MPGYGVIPALRFRDLEEAVRFYVDVLGFELQRGDLAGGNISVRFGDAQLMLESAAAEFYGTAYNQAIRQRAGTAGPNALYIEAEQIDTLAQRAASAGARILDPLAERPWGQREFTVEDPAGNWLTFWKSLGGANGAT
ncbi:MAG: VOC family protein [Dehalococcoidia bacterium]|nr:VOC family protein [Dehalococcoidia bacterium]